MDNCDTLGNDFINLNDLSCCDGLSIKREYTTDDESAKLSSSADNEQINNIISKKKIQQNSLKMYQSHTVCDIGGRGNPRLIIKKELPNNNNIDGIGTGPSSSSSVFQENDLSDHFINNITNNSSNDNDTIPNWNNNLFDRTDEFSLLGEEVAMKVRKLPTKYARCLVQYKIQRILFKAALGKYDYPPSEQQSSSEELAVPDQQQHQSSLNDAMPSTSSANQSILSSSSDDHQRSLTT